MGMLRLESVSINFVGVQAVKKVSFELTPSQITSVIGPNGAGKTTLFNLISGYYPPTEGKIFFDHMDVTRMPTYKRVRLSMGRSFQITTLFPELTVSEHLVVAASRESIWKLTNLTKERVKEVLQEVGLWDQKGYSLQRSDCPRSKKIGLCGDAGTKTKTIIAG